MQHNTIVFYFSRAQIKSGSDASNVTGIPCMTSKIHKCVKLPGILTNRPSSHCVCHTANKGGIKTTQTMVDYTLIPCVHLNHSTLWDQARGNPNSSVVNPSPVHTRSTPNSMGKSDKQGLVCARVHDDVVFIAPSAIKMTSSCALGLCHYLCS